MNRIGSIGLFTVSLLCSACNNNNSAPDMGPKCANGSNTCAAGGPLTGAADTHCMGMPAQVTSQAVCNLPPDMAGPQPDMAGVPDCPYGATMYGTSGDDDDCKYHLNYTVTPVYESTDVTFVVTAVSKVDNSPVVGAKVDAEVYLSDTHPAPNAPTKTVENPPGTYTIGPIHFDAPGACMATPINDACRNPDIADCWKVRFHLFENCFDVYPNSPHGHAAFFIKVP